MTTKTAALTDSRPARAVLDRLHAYWRLIKSLQTGLLLITALAGYVTSCCMNLSAPGMVPLLGSLFLVVSGATVFNMVLDRDLDARMARTARRPLPAGTITVWETVLLGTLLSLSGLVWSFSLLPAYGWVVTAGFGFDVVIYTWLLKRRTPLSILIGGLAGGMPVLAGRTLALGRVDLAGAVLALAILAWIPTHIMTLQIKYQADYRLAGVPTFPACYGVRLTRWFMAASTIVALALPLWAGSLIGASTLTLSLLAVAGAVLSGFALFSALRPHERLNFALYKSASFYMMAAMLLFIIEGL